MWPGLTRWCLGATLALLFAMTAAPPLGAQPDRVLRVGMHGIPAIPDPATALDGAPPLIARQVFDTLVRYRDVSSDFEPGLAVRWSPSKDGLIWTFTLRDGVRLHDGTLLTAQHVAASFERQMSPDHPLHPNPLVAWPRLLQGSPGVVKGVHALDRRTVQIELELPYAPLLTVLAHPAFSVVHPVSEEGGTTQWFGTGPFRIAEHRPGRIVLEANPWYWGEVPWADRIVFVEVGEEQAEVELQGGRLDIWIPPEAPPEIEGARWVPGWQVGLLTLQTDKEPFANKTIRQAVAAALDPALIAAAVERLAVPLQSFLPPGVWGRREGWPVMTANPVGARRTLAKAGAPEDLSVTLLVGDAPGGVDQARVAQAVQASLAAAGISLQVRTEAPEMATQLLRAGEHEMVLVEASVTGGDPHLFLYPLSTSEEAFKDPEALTSFYRNPRLHSLLMRASQLAWRPERFRLYQRAQVLLADELPWIPLYVRLHWAVVRPEVKNFRLHPSGLHRLTRVWVERSSEGGFR